MKKRLILYLSLGMCLVGCNVKGSNNQQVNEQTTDSLQVEIPSTAKLVDRQGSEELYVKVEQSFPNEDFVDVMSIWYRDTETGKTLCVLTTNPKAEARWSEMADGNAIAVGLDQIAAAEKVCFVDGALGRILVEGCPDARNVWTYIVDVKNMTAKQFPSNEGLLGFNGHEHYVILGSYRYLSEGGRYSVAQTYTDDGMFVREIKIEDD